METRQVRKVPSAVRRKPLGERFRWARQAAGLSHDRLVAAMGRSNRSHLIKIEAGLHVPRTDLANAIADACGVPRDLFTDDDEDPRTVELHRRMERVGTVFVSEMYEALLAELRLNAEATALREEQTVASDSQGG